MTKKLFLIINLFFLLHASVSSAYWVREAMTGFIANSSTTCVKFQYKQSSVKTYTASRNLVDSYDFYSLSTAYVNTVPTDTNPYLLYLNIFTYNTQNAIIDSTVWFDGQGSQTVGVTTEKSIEIVDLLPTIGDVSCSPPEHYEPPTLSCDDIQSAFSLDSSSYDHFCSAGETADKINCLGDTNSPLLDVVCSEKSCDGLAKSCIASCDIEVLAFSCSENEGVVSIDIPCTCSGGDLADLGPPPDLGEYGDVDDTSQKSDIADTDSVLLTKIVDNTANIATNASVNAKASEAELNELNRKTAQVNTTLKEIAVNQEKARLALLANPASVTVDVAASTGSIDLDLTPVVTELQTQNVGSFSGSVPVSGVGDAVFGMFSDRFTTFQSDLAASGLFSLPATVFGSIPASTESVMSVNFGSYGISDLDLSQYSSVFAVLKSIFVICASVVAVRIVTKGGA